MNLTRLFCSLALGLALAPAALRAAEFSAVLTDNAVDDEPAIETGVTYTADPAFGNPADSSGRRLINRDAERGNWNDVAGINYQDQTVVFDLQDTRRVDKVQLLFAKDPKPASVDISLGDRREGPWRDFGTLLLEERCGWYEAVGAAAQPARYVRLFFKLNAWGWYLNEVKIWGSRGAEPGPDEVLSTARAGGFLGFGGRPLLTLDGKPRASIIVAATPSKKALAAARVLQETLYKMSGAILPIRAANRTWTGTLLLVGPSELAKAKGIDVKQDVTDRDHYLLKTGKNLVALVGNDDQLSGTHYAVYDFLQRLGCGWFGPEPGWVVIPKIPTIAVPDLNVDERPAYYHRSIWMVNTPELQYAWRLGGSDFGGVGHNLGGVVDPTVCPQAYLQNAGQPCLTDPASIKTAVAYCEKQIQQTAGVAYISLCPNDTDSFCECKPCQAVGNHSARMMHFSNAIARELAKTYPGRYQLGFLAYWTTHGCPSPMIQAEPGVSIMTVNEGDHLKPVNRPESPEIAGRGRSNTREMRDFAGWKETGGLVGIYEWWIPGCSNADWRQVPWYPGEVTMQNLRFWSDNGIRFITCESQYEDHVYPLRWPLYYVGARGMWDTKLTASQIMQEACAKLYGPAAGEMLAYYGLLEQAAFDCKAAGGNWHLPGVGEVYSPDVETAATQRLEAAATATSDAAILARIQEETKNWDDARATIAKARAAQVAPSP
jgi:hypothetical protein